MKCPSHRTKKKDDDVHEDKNSETSTDRDDLRLITLGPQHKPETLYELNLRGHVDQIYVNNGPKPFKFDEEVVSVFEYSRLTLRATGWSKLWSGG